MIVFPLLVFHFHCCWNSFFFQEELKTEFLFLFRLFCIFLCCENLIFGSFFVTRGKDFLFFLCISVIIFLWYHYRMALLFCFMIHDPTKVQAILQVCLLPSFLIPPRHSQQIISSTTLHTQNSLISFFPFFFLLIGKEIKETFGVFLMFGT